MVVARSCVTRARADRSRLASVGCVGPVLSLLSPRVVERLCVSMDVRFIDRGIDRPRLARRFLRAPRPEARID